MRSVNAAYPGFLYQTRSSTDPNIQSGSWSYSGYVDYRHVVAGSSIVRGNRRDPNNWSYNLLTRKHGPLSAGFTTADGKVTDTYSGNYTAMYEGLATFHSQALTDVRAAAYANLLDNLRGSLDVSIDAFQAKQLRDMPKSIERALKNTFKIVRTIRRFDPKRIMKEAGNAHLMYTYGVVPTLQTIYDGINGLAGGLTRGDLTVVRGRSSLARTATSSGTGWPDTAGWTWTSRSEGSYGCRVVCCLRIPDDTVEQASRWTSLNPANIAWELTPWSFVVDWFIDVGGYLRSLETRLIYNKYFVNGYVSTRWDIATEQNAKRSGTQPGTGAKWSGYYPCRGRDKGMTRQLLGSLPEIPAPRLNTDLKTGQLINAAALLSTFLRR